MSARKQLVRGSYAVLSILAALAACAHDPAPAQPTARRVDVAAKQPASAASAAAEPAASGEAGSELGHTADELEPPPPVRIEDYMNGHFVIATWSRDAVINGSIDALREPLLTLADFDYGPVAPGAWMANIAALQATARATANATTVEGAALGVATMARQCGDCHDAERHKPYFGPDIRARQSRPPGSLLERMERHIWAADRLWEGLIAPSEDAWNAGAALPLESSSSETGLRPEFIGPLRQLRALGESALAAETRDARTNAFAHLLAACASCHAHEDQLRD